MTDSRTHARVLVRMMGMTGDELDSIKQQPITRTGSVRARDRGAGIREPGRAGVREGRIAERRQG